MVYRLISHSLHPHLATSFSPCFLSGHQAQFAKPEWLCSSFSWLFFFSPFLTALVILPAIFCTIVRCPPGPCFIRSTPSLNYPQIYLFMLSGSSPFLPTFLLPPCLLLGCLDGLQRARYQLGISIPPAQSHLPPKILVQSSEARSHERRADVQPAEEALSLGKCCLRGAGWLSPSPRLATLQNTQINTHRGCLLDKSAGQSWLKPAGCVCTRGRLRTAEQEPSSAGKARALQNSPRAPLPGSPKRKEEKKNQTL